MDIAEKITEYIIKTKFEDLPPRVVQATKQHILHTLATIVGGSAMPGCKTVVDLVTEWGGNRESTVLVYGHRVLSVHAALANGTMAHALDFCLNDDRTDYKSTVVVVPAVMAVMERCETTPGRDLLTAIYLGIEIGIRMALAINPKPAHALSSMIGVFAGAASAAKMLGLNAEQTLHAMSLGYCQIGKSGSGLVSPSLTKRLKAGLAAQASVFSALLAAKNFKGNRDIFQGSGGYYCTYHGQEGDLEEIVSGLGQRFETANVYPKAFPCCRGLQASIEATLDLVREHSIKADDVQAVTVYEGEQNPSVRDKSEPGLRERLRHPRGVVDAQFSIPWGVASAIARGDVFIGNFTMESLADAMINKLADKVEVVFDFQLNDEKLMSTPTIVEIKSKQGQTYSRRLDFAKGNPQNPISLEETKNVLRRCSDYAAKTINKEKIERVIELIDGLEYVDDSRKILKALATPD